MVLLGLGAACGSGSSGATDAASPGTGGAGGAGGTIANSGDAGPHTRIVDSAFGEECDLGNTNGAPIDGRTYCSIACKIVMSR